MTTLKLDSQVKEESANPSAQRGTARSVAWRRARRTGSRHGPTPRRGGICWGRCPKYCGPRMGRLWWGIVAVSALYIVANSVIGQGRTGGTPASTSRASGLYPSPLELRRHLPCSIRVGACPSTGSCSSSGGDGPSSGTTSNISRQCRRISGADVRYRATNRSSTPTRYGGRSDDPARCSPCLVLVQFFVQRVGDQELVAAQGRWRGRLGRCRCGAFVQARTVDQDLERQWRAHRRLSPLLHDVGERRRRPTAKDKKVTMQASAQARPSNR